MNEPAKYILEEWDSMCAIAHKARQGNCPLIEDEVLVEMHKYVGALDSRVVALENALKNIVRSRVLSRVVDSNYYADAVKALKMGDL